MILPLVLINMQVYLYVTLLCWVKLLDPEDEGITTFETSETTRPVVLP